MRVHIIILLLIGLLTSCCTKQQSYPEAMIQAEACIVASPDSALTLLSTLEEEIKDEPRETQMYYNLLTIKAQDKLYISHTSDSLIKVITEFYENYGDSEKLMEAYYYLGSTYRDMKDAPQALKAFQNVVDVGKDSRRYDVLAQTYGQMGTLYIRQELYDEALLTSKHALKFDLLLNNLSKTSIDLRDIARAYHSQKQTDSAFTYYNKAYKSALESKNTQTIYSLLSEIGCFYYDIGKIDTAKTILIQSIHNNYDIKNALVNLGMLYYNEDKLDSAEYYFKEVVKCNDIYKQRYGYIYLSHLEAKKGNYVTALNHAYKFLNIRDSIDIITKTEAISKIKSLYDYQHIEEENNQLKLDNERSKTQLYRLFAIFMFFVIISLSAFIYLRKKKQKAIEKERKLHQFQEQQYAQSRERIEDNNKKIHTLKLQLEKAAENDSINKQIIQTQKEQLEHINKQVAAIRHEQTLLESTFQQSPIYILFHRASTNDNIKITENDWTNLQMEIDKAYHNFTNRLYALYPQLSLLELHICYLIKISMQVKGIAKLLNRSNSAISLARTRLYKKIHGREGSVEKLDEFIIKM